MELIIYKDIPCPVLSMKEPDTFLILFKDEQKWIFECSLGYGEIVKYKYTIHYLFNGELHREGGPSVEYSGGEKQWYKNGKLHRIDGPAVERTNGDKFWYIENIEYSKEKYPNKIEQMKRDVTYNL